MVKPVEERFVGQTLEDRLAHKFDDLQVAREEHQQDLFDEIAKSIEVLMKGVPEAYEELMREKNELDKDLEAETMAITQEAGVARDEIYKQMVYQTRGFKALWDYREVYEEIIIEIMQKYKLIPMRTPIKSHLEGPSGEIFPRRIEPSQMQDEIQNVPPPIGYVPQQQFNSNNQPVPIPPPMPPPQQSTIQAPVTPSVPNIRPPAVIERKKKPRLSFRKQRGQNQPQDFDL